MTDETRLRVMSVTPPHMTADALLHLPHDGRRRELIAGTVRVMEPSGFGHGVVSGRIGHRLAAWVDDHALGVTLTADPGFVLETDPDTVRAPDVAFVRQDRYEAIGHTIRFWPEAPELAVEVVSPNDPFSEVEEKAFQWLAAGTRLVLVADPRRRTITAYRAPDDVRLHAEGEVVDAGDAVPGWTLGVADAFGPR